MTLVGVLNTSKENIDPLTRIRDISTDRFRDWNPWWWWRNHGGAMRAGQRLEQKTSLRGNGWVLENPAI